MNSNVPKAFWEKLGKMLGVEPLKMSAFCMPKTFWEKLGEKLGVEPLKMSAFCRNRYLEWGKVQIYYDVSKSGSDRIVKTKVRLPINYESISEEGLRELLYANTVLSAQIGVSVCIYDEKDVVLVDLFGTKNIEKIVEITMTASAAAVQISLDIEKARDLIITGR